MASKREELARKYGLDQQAGNQPSGSRLEQMNQQYGITKQGSSQTGAGNHLIESLAQKYGISQQTGNGSKRDELAKKYGLANAPVVDEKFLNQFQNNVKLYSHGYQRAIEGMNAGNYDKLFALWDDKRNNISNQSYQIRQWMDAQDWTGNEAYQEQLKGYLDEVDQFSANTRRNLSQNRDAYQAQEKHDRLTGYDLDGAQGELEWYQEQLKRYMGLMDQKDIDALQEKIQTTQRDIEEATEYQSWYRTQDAYYEGLDVEATTETVAQLRQEVERLESEYDHMWDEFQHNPNQTAEEYDRLLEQEAQYEQTLAQKKNRIAQLTADSRKATDYRAAQDMAMEALEAPDFKNLSLVLPDKEEGLSKEDYALVQFVAGDYNETDLLDNMGAESTRERLYMGYMERGYDRLTEEERGVFLYLYNKEGYEKARAYLASLEGRLAERSGVAIAEGLQNKPGWERAYGLHAGINSAIAGFQGLGDYLKGVEEYRAPTSVEIADSLIREDLGNAGFQLPEFMGGGTTAQMTHDLLLNSSRQLPAIGASALSNVLVPGSGVYVNAILAGGGAAGSSYREAINQGYSKTQARTFSTVVGASEAALGALLNGITQAEGVIPKKLLEGWLKNVDNAIGRIAINLAAKAGGEFTEEYLQEILEPVFRNICLDENNEIKLFTPEALYSGFLGALSATMMDAPGEIANAISTTRTGKELKQAGVTADQLKAIGETFDADSVAAVLAGRINENTGAYTIGRLFHEMGATLTEQNQREIAGYLQELGYDEGTAKRNAKGMARVIEGMATDPLLESVLEMNTELGAAMEQFIASHATLERTKQLYQVADTLEQHKANKGKANSDAPKKKPVKATEVRDGELYFEQDGKVVGAEELGIKDGNKVRLMETLGQMNPKAESAQRLLEHYDALPEEAREDYVIGMEDAFRYGQMGLTKVGARQGLFTRKLPSVEFSYAFNKGKEAGHRDTVSRDKARQDKGLPARGEGKVLFHQGSRELKATQKTALDTMRVLSKAVGATFQVFESYLSKDGVRVRRTETGEEVLCKENGWYDPATGIIHIDLNAGAGGKGTMLFTVAHELTHFIKDWSGEGYEALQGVLLKRFDTKGVSIQKLIQNKISEAKAAGFRYTEEQALDEVVADSMEAVLSSGKVMEMLAELKAKDAKTHGKVVSWLKSLRSRLKAMVDAYKGRSPDSLEGRLVQATEGLLEELEPVFAEALWKAGEQYGRADKKTAPEGGEVQYSLRDKHIPSWGELVSKEPIKVIDISKPMTTGSFRERRAQILENAEEIIKNPYLNKDTNTMIFLTKASYTHAFNNFGEIQLNAAEHLPELIENAILTHSEKPTHGDENTEAVYTFFAAARYGSIRPVKIKVKEYRYDGQRLPSNIEKWFAGNPGEYASSYDTVVLEVVEIEEDSNGSVGVTSENAQKPNPPESSAIKIADLLGLVKGEARKYIPFPENDGKRSTRNSQENLLALSDKGVAVLEYENGNNDDRLEKVNSVEGAKFSIRRTSKMSLEEQLKLLRKNELKSSDSLYFGETPASIAASGLKQIPLAYTTADYNKSKKGKHNVPTRALKRTKENLSNALFSFGQDGRHGFVVPDIDGDGKPLLIAIQENVNMDGILVNAVRSEYGLDNPREWLTNQIREGKKLVVYDEKGANSFLYPYGYSASRKEGIKPLDNNVQHPATLSQVPSSQNSMNQLREEQSSRERLAEMVQFGR